MPTHAHLRLPNQTGQFAAFTGLAECKPCTSGRHAAQDGLNACALCPSGQFRAEGTDGKACQKCPKGRFSSQVGASECERCPAGKSAATEGQKECEQSTKASHTTLSSKPVPGKAFFVSPELGDDKNNDGLSQQKPLKTLQNAESKASPGDTVYLMNGVYHNVGFGTGKTKNLSPVLVYVGRIFVRLSLELLSPCLVLVVIILPCSCIL